MAKLKIAEFADPGIDVLVIPRVPPLAQQVVTFTTATASAAFNAKTNAVRLISDTICAIEFAEANIVAPTAAVTTTAIKLNAQVAEYFHVAPGGSLNVVTDT